MTSIKEIEKFSQGNTLQDVVGLENFAMEFFQIFKHQIVPMLYKLYLKWRKMLLLFLWSKYKIIPRLYSTISKLHTNLIYKFWWNNIMLINIINTTLKIGCTMTKWELCPEYKHCSILEISWIEYSILKDIRKN